MRTMMAGMVAVLLSTVVIGCSGELMVARGYVTARTADEIFIDVGSANGIKTGDVLHVYADNSKRTFLSGEVKVVKVLGDDSSIAEVLSGNAMKGDRVEKWSR